MKSCRIIADGKGLSASFIELNKENKMFLDGLIEKMINPSSNTYIVCDTELYTYSEILEIFERKPRKNVSIGTYNPQNHIVITEKEILK